MSFNGYVDCLNRTYRILFAYNNVVGGIGAFHAKKAVGGKGGIRGH